MPPNEAWVQDRRATRVPGEAHGICLFSSLLASGLARPSRPCPEWSWHRNSASPGNKSELLRCTASEPRRRLFDQLCLARRKTQPQAASQVDFWLWGRRPAFRSAMTGADSPGLCERRRRIRPVPDDLVTSWDGPAEVLANCNKLH